MTTTGRPTRAPGAAFSAVVLWGALTLPGCADILPDGGAVTVATSWPASERALLERVYPGRVRWVALAEGDDLERVARHSRPPDVLLGGPASAYLTLERAGMLEPDPTGEGDGEPQHDAPSWRVARRGVLGVVDSPSAPDGRTSLPTFDDPRRDPVSLAWARDALSRGPWEAGYARLVRAAGAGGLPGRVPGSARGAVERGEASGAVSAPPWESGPAPEFQGGPAWVEGLAVLRNTRRPDQARAFVHALKVQGLAAMPVPTAAEDPLSRPGVQDFLADLLGATLIDARDELRAAWDVLHREGEPRGATVWMTAPPPWPPASVATILEKGSDHKMPLLETLARQVAPEADVRGWLMRSWLSPARPVDAVFLGELAGAADGRLAREPRFRAWLRSEWTAWARQRYRRVARKAEAAGTVPPGGLAP